MLYKWKNSIGFNNNQFLSLFGLTLLQLLHNVCQIHIVDLAKNHNPRTTTFIEYQKGSEVLLYNSKGKFLALATTRFGTGMDLQFLILSEKFYNLMK